MCGIAGFAGTGDVATLIKMGKVIGHRGPDQSGIHMDHSRHVRDIGLAHQRLSIIDLSPAGNQPMLNEDGTIAIAFNGEIYNFMELRKEITTQYSGKHQFKGGSDTEIIIHLYEELGEKVFEKLHGMFAIALYDKKKDLVFLARDRMGKKPLYWSIVGEGAKTLLFASELKSLCEHQLFEKKISKEALNHYFFSEHIPTPLTIYENVFKLHPGSYVIWNGKEKIEKRFWKPDYTKFTGTYIEAQKHLDQLIEASVKERMVADVPLGVFLSGGIDSSTIAWYAQKSKERGQGNIKTFSIGFENTSFDESVYALSVAQHLGTDHYNKIIGEKELLDVVPRLGSILDEPMADSSIIPTTVLSEWTKQHVTVSLGGDGGDELFFGYDTFLAHKLARYTDWVPKSILSFFKKIIDALPVSFNNMSLDFKLKSFMGGLSEKDIIQRNELWLAAYNDDEIRLLLKDEYSIPPQKRWDFIDKELIEENFVEDWDKFGRSYERFYMLDHVLVKVDRASMTHALEVRAPLLSTQVVEFAHSLPHHFKQRGFKRKAILKDMMRGRIPDAIIDRTKKGFGMPIAEWLAGPLKPTLLEYTSKEYIEKQGLFNHDYIQRIISEHVDRKVDQRKKLWTLFVFQLWWDKWMK
jgi:asparagine synthase (glutamine-hydrolysing)